MPDKLTVECLEWKPFERNTLKGFAKIRVPAMRLAIDGVAIHQRDGRSWAQLPAKPMLSEKRELAREADGKIRYAKILEFESKEVADAFSRAAVAAVGNRIFKRDFEGAA
jgi:hypothetical protein